LAKSKTSKSRIIIPVLIIVVFVILFTPSDLITPEPIATDTVQSELLSSGDVFLTNEQLYMIDKFQSNSIVSTDTVFTESDDNLVTQFLDEAEIDLPLASEKFGIEVQTVLFDSEQNQFPFSTILNIPQLTVTDNEGRLLDLGSIQTTFLGITTDDSDKSFKMNGVVEFWLDDDLIAKKHLYASETDNKKTYQLSLVNNLTVISENIGETSYVNESGTTTSVNLTKKVPIPPSFTERKSNFTFTLSDEGKNWADGSKHTYRVVIRDVHANIDSQSNFKVFDWSGEKIAYQLDVTVDQSKKTVIGAENKAVKIFKSDSTISICGESLFHDSKHQHYPIALFTQISLPPPSVTVSSNGKQIINMSYDFKPQSMGDVRRDNFPQVRSDNDIRGEQFPQFHNVHVSNGVDGKTISSSAPTYVYTNSGTISYYQDDQPLTDKSCSKVSGIPRDSDVTFTVNGESFEIHTPKSQANYFLKGELNNPKDYRSNTVQWAGSGSMSDLMQHTVTSNFGYGLDSGYPSPLAR